MGGYLIKGGWGTGLAATKARVNALRAVCAGPVTLQFRGIYAAKPLPPGIAHGGVLTRLSHFGLVEVERTGPRGSSQETYTATDDGRAVLSAFDQAQAKRQKRERRAISKNLVAAAPDLLAALSEMVRWSAKRGGPDDLPLPADQQDPEVAQAMAAIAKAEGRS